MSYGRNNNYQSLQKPDRVYADARKTVNKRDKLSKLHDYVGKWSKNKRKPADIVEASRDVIDLHMMTCLELNDADTAKDALHHFRRLLIGDQGSAGGPGTLRYKSVVEKLIASANIRVVEAKKLADDEVLAQATQVADVDEVFDDSPENIMLAGLTDDMAKRRKDDAGLLVPRMKFMYAVYGAVEGVLQKHKDKEEELYSLYHNVLRQAFQFCGENSGKHEFRKLCEKLGRDRDDFRKLCERLSKETIKGGWTPDRLLDPLKTRHAQFATARKMSLWREADQAIEYMNMLNEQIVEFFKKASTKKIQSKFENLMADYYICLTHLFWASDGIDKAMFHAFACLKYYSYVPDDAVAATAVMLATLCVPLDITFGDCSHAHSYLDEEKDKSSSRARRLLSLSALPSRDKLISDVSSSDVLSKVHVEFQGLYDVLEGPTNPLLIMKKLEPYLKTIQLLDNDSPMACLKQYVAPLKECGIIRTVAKISKMYRSVKLNFLEQLLSPSRLSFCDVQSILIRAVNRDVSRKVLQLRIDHAKGFVHFSTKAVAASSIETQVARFGKAMQSISIKIRSAQSVIDAKISRIEYLNKISSHADEYYQGNIRRIAEIEQKIKKKEEETRRLTALEKQQREKDEEERQKKEEERLIEEEKKRAKIKLEKFEKEKKIKEIMDTLEVAGAKVDAEKIKISTDDEKKKMLDAARLKIQKSKDDEVQKKNSQLKRLDHLTRAIRQEEAARVIERYEKHLKEDRDLHEAKIEQHLKAMREKHDKDLIEKERVSRMQAYRQKFEVSIVQAQRLVYEEDMTKRRLQIAIEHKKKKLADARQRKKDTDDKRREMEIEEERRLAREEEDRLATRKQEELLQQQREEEAREREQQALQKARRDKYLEEAAVLKAEKEKTAKEAEKLKSSSSSYVYAAGDRRTQGGNSFIAARTESDDASSWRTKSKSKGSLSGGESGFDRGESRSNGTVSGGSSKFVASVQKSDKFSDHIVDRGGDRVSGELRRDYRDRDGERDNNNYSSYQSWNTGKDVERRGQINSRSNFGRDDGGERGKDKGNSQDKTKRSGNAPEPKQNSRWNDKK
jgi:translation initiation factor 3 subunit A